MAKPKKPACDGIVVRRDVTPDGYVHTYDRNDRACWSATNRERVVLTHDLRRYGEGLHIGQLGWTVPGTTDGYKWIEVEFDTGQRLLVLVQGISAVDSAKGYDIAATLLAEHRNTRFDAEVQVALQCHQAWVKKCYEPYLAVDEMAEHGEGNQELYAFTFPTLRELAGLKGRSTYPVKIGYTGREDDGALGRIRQLITEAASYPERPSVLMVWRTWDGRMLETLVHRELRARRRSVSGAIGKEWFLTSREELLQILGKSIMPPPPIKRPARGSDKTLEEGLDALREQGIEVRIEIDRESAAVRIGTEPANRHRIVPEEKSSD